MTQIILGFLIAINLFLPVSSTDDALANFINPAGLSTARNFNLYYLYNFSGQNFNQNHSVALQVKNFGLAVSELRGVKFSLGGSLSKSFSLGASYYKVVGRHFGDIGILARPNRYLSIGLVIESIAHRRPANYLVGIGIRPINERWTVTADYSYHKKKLMLGLETEPIAGLQLKGYYSPDRTVALQIGISQAQYGLGLFYKKNQNLADKAIGYLSFHKEIRHKLLRSKNHLLEITLHGRIDEQKSGFSLFGAPVSFTIYELLSLINKAKDDNEVSGIILRLQNPQMGFSTAQELKLALDDFRARGKKIFVYAPNLNLTNYYLVCNADKIIIHPVGEVAILGITTQATLMKGALDKLGITADYERIGKYKNAPEFYAQDSLSPETYEVLNSILDNCYQEIVKTFARARNKSEEEVIADLDCGLFTSSKAKEQKLIDLVLYEDQLDSFIKAEFGKFKKISQNNYQQESYNYRWGPLPKITIIYAEGEITEGESRFNPLTGTRNCGAKTIKKLLEEARADPEVKAIILRIDSPGGDGFASDLIWRELYLTKNKKPVIVSMGSVAASGGYYIAMLGNKIFAMPTTITGSIGVFSMKFVTQGLYEKIGIKRIQLKRGVHADMFSQERTFTEDERMVLKEQLSSFYEQFISKVANARNLSLAYVDSVGQGRIWTGNEALDHKLVDSLGSLWTALEYAKDLIHQREVIVEILPKEKFSIHSLTRLLFNMLTNL